MARTRDPQYQRRIANNHDRRIFLNAVQNQKIYPLDDTHFMHITGVSYPRNTQIIRLTVQLEGSAENRVIDIPFNGRPLFIPRSQGNIDLEYYEFIRRQLI